MKKITLSRVRLVVYPNGNGPQWDLHSKCERVKTIIREKDGKRKVHIVGEVVEASLLTT